MALKELMFKTFNLSILSKDTKLNLYIIIKTFIYLTKFVFSSGDVQEVYKKKIFFLKHAKPPSIKIYKLINKQ